MYIREQLADKIQAILTTNYNSCRAAHLIQMSKALKELTAAEANLAQADYWRRKGEKDA